MVFPAGAQVVVNEVLYDPEGADTGLEFVELLNCGREGVLLTGWTLESGNGAQPGDWTVEWIGDELDYLEPGAIYLIGESGVVPVPDYVTPIDLQNGPDGVRLTDGTAPVDVVGWGEPLFHEYYEGSPAPDVASGQSLARSPDCFDHDDNSIDFVRCPLPTPGTRNALGHDLSLRVRHAGRDVYPADVPVGVVCVVKNVGSLLAEGGSATLELFVGVGEEPDGSAEVAVALAPRDSTVVSVEWPRPRPGYHRALVRLLYPPDADTDNNVDATSFNAGDVVGLVAINELMYSPGDSATEWVEMLNTTEDALDLSGWMLGDDEDAHCLAADDAALDSLHPGGFLVLARDPELLNGLASCPVAGADDWEALSADDTVALLDEFGTLMDEVTYERRWGGDRDVSLERVRPDMPAANAVNWGSSVAPEGSTPGRTNSIHLAAAPSPGKLTVTPNPFTPDGDGENDRTVVRFELPVGRATARLTVFDIKGRVRAVLLDQAAVASEGEFLWDGTGVNGEPLPSGLYVVYLEAIDARQGVLVTAKSVVGIVR